MLTSSGGGVNDEGSDVKREFLAHKRFWGGKSDSLSSSSEGFGVINPFGSPVLLFNFRLSELNSSIFCELN